MGDVRWTPGGYKGKWAGLPTGSELQDKDGFSQAVYNHMIKWMDFKVEHIATQSPEKMLIKSVEVINHALPGQFHRFFIANGWDRLPEKKDIKLRISDKQFDYFAVAVQNLLELSFNKTLEGRKKLHREVVLNTLGTVLKKILKRFPYPSVRKTLQGMEQKLDSGKPQEILEVYLDPVFQRICKDFDLGESLAFAYDGKIYMRDSASKAKDNVQTMVHEALHLCQNLHDTIMRANLERVNAVFEEGATEYFSGLIAPPATAYEDERKILRLMLCRGLLLLKCLRTLISMVMSCLY